MTSAEIGVMRSFADRLPSTVAMTTAVRVEQGWSCFRQAERPVVKGCPPPVPSAPHRAERPEGNEPGGAPRSR